MPASRPPVPLGRKPVALPPPSRDYGAGGLEAFVPIPTPTPTPTPAGGGQFATPTGIGWRLRQMPFDVQAQYRVRRRYADPDVSDDEVLESVLQAAQPRPSVFQRLRAGGIAAPGTPFGILKDVGAAFLHPDPNDPLNALLGVPGAGGVVRAVKTGYESAAAARVGLQATRAIRTVRELPLKPQEILQRRGVGALRGAAEVPSERLVNDYGAVLEIKNTAGTIEYRVGSASGIHLQTWHWAPSREVAQGKMTWRPLTEDIEKALLQGRGMPRVGGPGPATQAVMGIGERPAQGMLLATQGAPDITPPLTKPAATAQTALPYAASRLGIKTLYHETDPNRALELLMSASDKRGLNVSPVRELALGQGGKGALIEFGDTARIEVRPLRTKPSSAFMERELGYPSELEILSAPHEGLRAGITRITFAPAAKITRRDQARVETLKQMGWRESRLPDGAVQLEAPPLTEPGQAAQPIITEPPAGVQAPAPPSGGAAVPPPSAAPPPPPVRPPGAGTGGGKPPVPPPPPSDFEQARDKLIGLIKSAKPVREETQALYHQRRRQQAAILAQTFQKGGGEATLNKALGSLKGELPKAQFEPPAGLMTGEETVTLYNAMWESPALREFERVQAGSAFRQLFSAGAPPTRSSLALLERVFGKDFVEAVLGKRTLGQKVWEEFLGALSLPRTLLSTVDFSAPLRQGALLVGQPKAFGGALTDMVKTAFSEKRFTALDDAIRQHPKFEVAERAGLYVAPTGRAATLTELEEAFASRLAEKIPGVKIAQRAYVGFLNSLRSRAFYGYAEAWGDTATPEQYQKLATFINAASGRGTLGPLENAAPVVAQVFFSPRFLASRFQAPLSIAADNPLARGPSVSRVAARNLTAFVGMNVGLLSMLKASGLADVNLDPRSADFGKARIGNTRVDFFAGYAQIARFTAMAMTGTGVTGATGRPYDANRLETAIRFLRSKGAPIPGAAANVLSGRDLAGDELRWDGESVRDQAGNLLTPMNVQAVLEAVEEHGALGLVFGVPSTFGVGVNTYQSFGSQADIAAARKVAVGRLYPDAESYQKLSRDQRVQVDRSREVQDALKLLDPAEMDALTQDWWAGLKTYQGYFTLEGRMLARAPAALQEELRSLQQAEKRVLTKDTATAKLYPEAKGYDTLPKEDREKVVAAVTRSERTLMLLREALSPEARRWKQRLTENKLDLRRNTAGLDNWLLDHNYVSTPVGAR